VSIVRKNRLLVRWSRKENDFLISYPSKPDGHFIFGLVANGSVRYEVLSSGKTFIEELEERGYDIKTLRIQVDRKKNVAL
jgi:hypothetical protein